MDLYGINSAISEGNSRTQDNDLYNEQIKTARDTINNQIDSEIIKAKGAASAAQQTQSQDKLLYAAHDALGTANLYSSFSKFGQSSKALTAEGLRNPKGTKIGNFFRSQAELARTDNPYTKAIYGAGPAPVGDKVASIVTDKVGVSDAVTSAYGKQAKPVLAQGVEVKTLSSSSPATAEETPTAPTDPAPETPTAPTSTTNTPAAAETNTPTRTSDPDSTETLEKTSTPDSFDKTKAIVSETGEKIGRGLRVAGDIGGAVSTYELFKNGLAKQADGKADVVKDISQVAGAVGTGLDILGAFIPILEPFGELANAVGAVASTIDTVKTDSKATSSAQGLVTNLPKKAASQVAGLGPLRSGVAVNSMVSSGLVATQAQHIQNHTQGTGSF